MPRVRVGGGYTCGDRVNSQLIFCFVWHILGWIDSFLLFVWVKFFLRYFKGATKLGSFSFDSNILTYWRIRFERLVTNSKFLIFVRRNLIYLLCFNTCVETNETCQMCCVKDESDSRYRGFFAKQKLIIITFYVCDFLRILLTLWVH